MWLVSLPKPLVAIVLQFWLDLPDVARLDSACCWKSFRSKVLSIMRSPAFEYELPLRKGPHSLYCNDLDESKVAAALMDWLLIRNVRVNVMYLAGPSNASSLPLRTYLTRNGSLVTKVYICKVSGHDLSWFEYLAAIFLFCPNVLEFNMSNSNIITFDDYMGIIRRWPALQRITLGDKCTDTVLLALAKGCPQLRAIEEVWTSTPRCTHAGYLAFFKIAGAHIEEIRVDLPSTGAELCAIAKCCPNLRSLFLSSTDRLNDTTLTELAQLCPHLEAIALHLVMPTFTMAGVKTITRRGNLTELELSYPKRWTDGKDGWPEIVRRNCSLRTLEVDIEFLTPAALLPLARYCTQLVTVVLNCYDASALLRTPGTAERILIDIARSNPHLAVLELEQVPFSDAVLVALGAYCRHLVRVTFTPSAGITNTGVIALAQGCPHLRRVSALLVPVTMVGVTALARHCRCLRQVEVGAKVMGAGQGAGTVVKVGALEVSDMRMRF
jgi:hypothetical protein